MNLVQKINSLILCVGHTSKQMLIKSDTCMAVTAITCYLRLVFRVQELATCLLKLMYVAMYQSLVCWLDFNAHVVTVICIIQVYRRLHRMNLTASHASLICLLERIEKLLN